MSRNQDNGELFLLVIVVIALGVFGMVWKFSEFFGIDMKTGGHVFLNLVIATGIYGAVLKFTPLELAKTWYFYVASVWFSFFPALDFWASKSAGPFAAEIGQSLPWYGMWYSQYGILLAIVGFGFAVNKYVFEQ
jgi:hypothetical protein